MFNVLDIRDQALNFVPHPPTLEPLMENMQCMQAASPERDTNPEHILKILQRKVGSQSAVPRRKPSSQSLPVKLGLRGP